MFPQKALCFPPLLSRGFCAAHFVKPEIYLSGEVCSPKPAFSHAEWLRSARQSVFDFEVRVLCNTRTLSHG